MYCAVITTTGPETIQSWHCCCCT